MRREYKVDASVGKPHVNFRERITQRTEFDYLHKKQSGGQGQYGRVIGYMEPLPLGSPTKFEFENMLVGQAIPSNSYQLLTRVLKKLLTRDHLLAIQLKISCIVLTDGAAHTVDSSELAFKLAAIYAFRQVPLNNMFEYSDIPSFNDTGERRVHNGVSRALSSFSRRADAACERVQGNKDFGLA